MTMVSSCRDGIRVESCHLCLGLGRGTGRLSMMAARARSQAHLCYSCAQVTADDVLVALQFGLDDNQGEVGLGVHVAGHVLDLLDLGLDTLVDALEDAIRGPPTRSKVSERARIKSLRVEKSQRGPGGGDAHSKSSGAHRSATQTRVRVCRSRVSRGIASNVGSTSRRISSISIGCGALERFVPGKALYDCKRRCGTGPFCRGWQRALRTWRVDFDQNELHRVQRRVRWMRVVGQPS